MNTDFVSRWVQVAFGFLLVCAMLIPTRWLLVGFLDSNPSFDFFIVRFIVDFLGLYLFPTVLVLMMVLAFSVQCLGLVMTSWCRWQVRKWFAKVPQSEPATPASSDSQNPQSQNSVQHSPQNTPSQTATSETSANQTNSGQSAKSKSANSKPEKSKSERAKPHKSKKAKASKSTQTNNQSTQKSTKSEQVKEQAQVAEQGSAKVSDKVTDNIAEKVTKKPTDKSPHQVPKLTSYLTDNLRKHHRHGSFVYRAKEFWLTPDEKEEFKAISAFISEKVPAYQEFEADLQQKRTMYEAIRNGRAPAAPAAGVNHQPITRFVKLEEEIAAGQEELKLRHQELQNAFAKQDALKQLPQQHWRNAQAQLQADIAQTKTQAQAGYESYLDSLVLANKGQAYVREVANKYIAPFWFYVGMALLSFAWIGIVPFLGQTWGDLFGLFVTGAKLKTSVFVLPIWAYICTNATLILILSFMEYSIFCINVKWYFQWAHNPDFFTSNDYNQIKANLPKHLLTTENFLAPLEQVKFPEEPPLVQLRNLDLF